MNEPDLISRNKAEKRFTKATGVVYPRRSVLMAFFSVDDPRAKCPRYLQRYTSEEMSNIAREANLKQEAKTFRTLSCPNARRTMESDVLDRVEAVKVELKLVPTAAA